MNRLPLVLAATVFGIVAVPAFAQAVPPVPAATTGIRLEVSATGEVARAPDQVTLSAGVTTRSPQAEAALRDNAAQMASVRAALQRAGIEARDIQTGSISLSQDYEQGDGGRPRPSGYSASNQLNIRFRDIGRAGRIIDALVAAGANSVNGPGFDIADREGATDEARMRALAAARTRAELYARTLGVRVRRIVAISEGGGTGPRPMMDGYLRAQASAPETNVEPGQQIVSATVSVMFELEQPAG